MKDVYNVDSEDESSVDSSFMSDNESHFSEFNYLSLYSFMHLF
jgi:hypothetical protein